MANIPVFNCDNISIGPGIMFIGAAGTTPTIDVGAISEDGMEITVTQEFVDVMQGNPKSLVCRFKTGEDVELVASGLEWNLPNLAFALGGGVTTSTSTLDTYAFGSSPSVDDVAVRIQHAMPAGDTISFLLWRAQILGEWTLTLAQDELQTFPYSFKGLIATQNWGGETLPVGEQFFRIEREKVT
jgi:hypothetical protein